VKRPKDPQAVADKQIQKAQNAGPDWLAGINAVTDSPMAAAAAKQQKMLSNLTSSVTSGKWAAGLLSVSTAAWQQACATKGQARYGAGVAAARDKIVAFQTQWQPFVAAQAAKVNAMPDLTLEDRLNKASAMGRALSTFSRQRPRGS
jgi:hypothetical protein